MLRSTVTPWLCCLLVLALASPGCDGEPAGGEIGLDVTPDAADAIDTAVAPAAGRLTLLTYNVAGLLEGISKSHPEANHPLIGPLASAFDVALVQEDFCYHGLLDGGVALPYRSAPEFDPGCTAFGPEGDVGDGLNRFSAQPFSGHARYDWATCHGETDCASDCLTNKGFTLARHTLAPGVELDVYNLHVDAGSCEGDLVAKQAQVEQLAAAVEALSGDRAVVIAGDTNLRWERPTQAPIYDALLSLVGGEDSCRLASCGDEDRIDRFVVRSSEALALTVERWWIPEGFVDEAGEPLSDHEPVVIELAWRVE